MALILNVKNTEMVSETYVDIKCHATRGIFITKTDFFSVILVTALLIFTFLSSIGTFSITKTQFGKQVSVKHVLKFPNICDEF